MKSALKRFASFYLNSWWLPPVLWAVYLMTLAWLFLSRMIRPSAEGESSILETVCGVVYWCLLAGVLASWIWLLIKKRWRNVFWSALFLVGLWGFSGWLVNYLLVITGWRSG